jgi:uncharacterized protein YcbK (DUF882 family)
MNIIQKILELLGLKKQETPIIEAPKKIEELHMVKKITMEEYLMNRAEFNKLSKEYQTNALTTVERANKLLEAFGEYRKVNSGYRRPEDNAAAGGSKMSNHMKCSAIDLEDKDKRLSEFIKTNIELVKDLELWFESPEHTPTWLHAQIIPPKSGKRFFIP